MCDRRPLGVRVRRFVSAGAASFATILLVFLCFGTAARAATAPYTLLGMAPSSDYENWGFVPDAGGLLVSSSVEPTLGLEQNAFAQWTGKRNAVAQVYGYPLGPTGAPSNSLVPDLETIWGTGAVPMLAWGQSVQDVNSGHLDGEITALAVALKQWLAGPDGVYGNGDDRRLYIRYDWEMNMNWAPWSPCGPNAPSVSDFIKAWQHVHDIFTSEGLDRTHVAWVFSPDTNNQCGVGKTAKDLYPGPQYVDWLGIDGYSDPPDLSCADAPSASALFGPMISELTAADSTKPMSIDEVGVDSLLGTACKNQWITDYFSYLANNNIRMSLWFNANIGSTSKEWAIFDQVYPVDPKLPTAGNSQLPSYGDQVSTYKAFGAVPSNWLGFSAYNTAVQSSSLVGGCFQPCANPRILTDQQFLGQ
jgi:glycosyl hydrolase family 26